MTAIGVAVVTTLGGIIIAIVETVRGRRTTERAADASHREHQDSTTHLGEISDQLKEMSRDISGIREEIRHERIERFQLEQTVIDHLKGDPHD